MDKGRSLKKTSASINVGDYGHRYDITVLHESTPPWRAYVGFQDDDDLLVIADRFESLAAQLRLIKNTSEAAA